MLEEKRIEVYWDRDQLNLQADTPKVAIAKKTTKNIANTLKFIFLDCKF